MSEAPIADPIRSAASPGCANVPEMQTLIRILHREPAASPTGSPTVPLESIQAKETPPLEKEVQQRCERSGSAPDTARVATMPTNTKTVSAEVKPMDANTPSVRAAPKAEPEPVRRSNETNTAPSGNPAAKGPENSVLQSMREAAERGDIDAILRLMNGHAFPSFHQDKALECVRMALENVAHDPPRLLETLFNRMLIFQGTLMVRAELHVSRETAQYNKRTPGSCELPPGIKDDWLPRISKLQTQISETSRAYTAAMHTMAIAGYRPARKRGRIVKLVEKSEGSSRKAAST